MSFSLQPLRQKAAKAFAAVAIFAGAFAAEEILVGAGDDILHKGASARGYNIASHYTPGQQLSVSQQQDFNEYKKAARSTQNAAVALLACGVAASAAIALGKKKKLTAAV